MKKVCFTYTSSSWPVNLNLNNFTLNDFCFFSETKNTHNQLLALKQDVILPTPLQVLLYTRYMSQQRKILTCMFMYRITYVAYATW